MCEDGVSFVILASVKNHPNLVEGVLLCLQELNNRLQGNRCCEPDGVNKRACRDGWNRDAVQLMLCCYLQAPPISTRQQLTLMLITTSPDRTDRVDHMSRLEVTSCSDDCITNRTTANAATFLVNLWATFRVDGAICAVAFVQSPMRGCDDGVSILIGNVACDETQCGLSIMCKNRIKTSRTGWRGIQLAGSAVESSLGLDSVFLFSSSFPLMVARSLSR